MCDMYTWQRRGLFIRDKPILSSEKLHKDYDRKNSVAKNKSLVVSLKGLGADELVGGKPPVVKQLWLWISE
jgi:hypothetical protein